MGNRPEAAVTADATFATIHGYRLRYRLTGEGPLAVFGHGLLGAIEQVTGFTDGVEGLNERVRLLLYDARGHGRSDGPEEASGYTWETLGRDMIALVQHAGEERAIFAGASMGAASALWAAIEEPAYVRALLLFMPPPLGPEALYTEPEREALATLNMLAGVIGQFGLEQTAALARQFMESGATAEAIEEQVRTLLEQNPRTIHHAIAGLMHAPQHTLEDYRRISVPTLIIGHEHDGLHPVRSAQMLADTIAGSRMVIAPEPEYWQEHPAEFMAVVDEFFAGLPDAE